MSTTKSQDDEDEPPNQKPHNAHYTERLFALATKALLSTSVGLSWPLIGAEERKELKISREQRQTDLLKELSASGIDPLLFDILLSNEVNRRMKLHFGIAFLALTCLFTTISYAIVVLDGVYKWSISPVAITALIIETPIQFIGLLYIIARNLFPQPLNEPEKSLTQPRGPTGKPA